MLKSLPVEALTPVVPIIFAVKPRPTGTPSTSPRRELSEGSSRSIPFSVVLPKVVRRAPARYSAYFDPSLFGGAKTAVHSASVI